MYRSVGIPPSDKKRNAERTGHLGSAALAEAQRKVADGLGQRLDRHRLVVGEVVVLGTSRGWVGGGGGGGGRGEGGGGGATG